jgi:hypothetical protein
VIVANHRYQWDKLEISTPKLSLGSEVLILYFLYGLCPSFKSSSIQTNKT